MPHYRRAQPAKHIYGILHSPTSQFIAFGAKAAWNGSGPAKNAFNLHVGEPLEDCADYELVNLTEAYFQLEGLSK
jgi:hypothetical protein